MSIEVGMSGVGVVYEKTGSDTQLEIGVKTMT